MGAAEQSLGERIAEIVSAETDRDILELPPLYESADPEALETLCASLDTGSVTFEYVGHKVTVHADRTIELSTSTNPTSQAPKRSARD